MLNHTLLLHGLRDAAEGLPGALVGDLLEAVDRGAKGAVRLRLEGRSWARGGPPPAWVNEAATFQVAGFHRGTPGLELRMRTLAEALPARFAQEDLFPPVDPADSALTLTGQTDAIHLRRDDRRDAGDCRPQRLGRCARLTRLKQMPGELVPVSIRRERVLRAYAEFNVALSRAGKHVGQDDLWIAAAAVTGAVVLTTDRDFDVLHPTHVKREWVDPQSLR